MERLVVTFPAAPGHLSDGTPKTHYGIRVRTPDGDIVLQEEAVHATVNEASETWGKIQFGLCHGDTSESELDRRLIDLCKRGMVEVLGVE